MGQLLNIKQAFSKGQYVISTTLCTGDGIMNKTKQTSRLCGVCVPAVKADWELFQSKTERLPPLWEREINRHNNCYKKTNNEFIIGI